MKSRKVKQRSQIKRREPIQPEMVYQRAMPEAAKVTAETHCFMAMGRAVHRAMKRKALTRTSLAKLLNQPESYVAHLVDGRNMTLRTLASLAHTLGCYVEMEFVDIKVEEI